MDHPPPPLLLLLLPLSLLFSQSFQSDPVWYTYQTWLTNHSKPHHNSLTRFQIFKDNLLFINNHNNINRSSFFKLGLNLFADLTNEEYRSMYLGIKGNGLRLKLNRSGESERYVPCVGEELPESVDWRKEGAVSEVKDQGSCGSACICPEYQHYLEGIELADSISMNPLINGYLQTWIVVAYGSRTLLH